MLSVSQSSEYTPRILLRRCVEEAEKCISSLQEALAAATLCINRRSTPSESIWDEPKGNRYLSEQRIDTSQSLSVAEIQPMSQSAPPPQTLPLLRGGVLDPVSIVVRTKVLRSSWREKPAPISAIALVFRDHLRVAGQLSRLSPRKFPSRRRPYRFRDGGVIQHHSLSLLCDVALWLGSFHNRREDSRASYKSDSQPARRRIVPYGGKSSSRALSGAGAVGRQQLIVAATGPWLSHAYLWLPERS